MVASIGLQILLSANFWLPGSHPCLRPSIIHALICVFMHACTESSLHALNYACMHFGRAFIHLLMH